MSDAHLVCLGAIAGAYGVRGEVRIKSFTERPDQIAAYGPLLSEDGETIFTLENVRPLKSDMLAARVAEVKTREAAEALKGSRLYAPRDALPDAGDDEFYYEDLIGLAAVHVDGRPMGEVRAVYDHGAGDLLELHKIPGVNGARLIPFTKDSVPEVDLKARRVIISPPEALLE